MKRKTKIGLGIAALGLSALILSSCTASFCSNDDRARILAAYDNGVCKFYDATDTTRPNDSYELTTINNVSGVYFTYDYKNNNGGLTKVNESAKSANIEYLEKNCEFWANFDFVIIDRAIKVSGEKVTSAKQLNELLINYNYLRYSKDSEVKEVWDNWDSDVEAARKLFKENSEAGRYNMVYNISKLPNTDYLSLYKTTLTNATANYRGCITTTDGNYGSYGWKEKSEVKIQGKDYAYGWSKGFFEGLLVYPIGALIDVTCGAMAGIGTGLNGTNGWAQLLTILIVTLIVRAFMFAVSFKSTINNAKMTELQPQIAKIQAKYPDANVNQSSKQRMSEEMNRLYKKNKINPFSSLLVMIVQFPLFICVWGAFTGSAWLSTGGFLGMNFSDSISSILFNGDNWANGSAWTALVLFILMALAQVAAMLIPQWMSKKRQQKVAKLGKNPAQTQQNRTMKIVTWVMMIMIIFMGFSLASAMGVYWFVGALISIGQSVITQAIISRQSKKGA